MAKLLIFDLDGTLINTLKDIAVSCNHALEMCGFPNRELNDYNTLVGRGIFNLFRGSLPEEARSENNIRRMAEIFVPYYDEHYADFSLPYDGITDMLEALTKSGIKLAIASNKYQAGTEAIVNKLLHDFEFIKILGQRDGMPIKPDPGIIEEAMSAFPEISKDEVVYCGDSNVDMETGRNAGVKTIGVTWGFRSREELEAYDPWLIVDTPEQIVEAVVSDSK